MTEPSVQLAVFRGLSDALHVILATGNHDALTAVLANISAAHSEGAITDEQLAELKQDVEDINHAV